MDIEDFIKLPASEAGWLCRHDRDAGDADEASRLHQAYFEAHRVKLSDDRQIAEATPPTPFATAASTGRVESARRPERSKVRWMGVLLSGVGLMIGLFAAAAGIGPAGLIIAGGMASIGFALCLVGILEDRLLLIHHELAAYSFPRPGL